MRQSMLLGQFPPVSKQWKGSFVIVYKVQRRLEKSEIKSGNLRVSLSSAPSVVLHSISPSIMRESMLLGQFPPVSKQWKGSFIIVYQRTFHPLQVSYNEAPVNRLRATRRSLFEQPLFLMQNYHSQVHCCVSAQALLLCLEQNCNPACLCICVLVLIYNRRGKMVLGTHNHANHVHAHCRGKRQYAAGRLHGGHEWGKH